MTKHCNKGRAKLDYDNFSSYDLIILHLNQVSTYGITQSHDLKIMTSTSCSRLIELTSVKVEAGAGLRGPGMEPVGAGGQTGVAVGAGQLGCGQPEGK